MLVCDWKLITWKSFGEKGSIGTCKTGEYVKWWAKKSNPVSQMKEGNAEFPYTKYFINGDLNRERKVDKWTQFINYIWD